MTPEFKTIRQIHDAYDSKKISPVELTEHYLGAIEKDDLNAFLTVCRERAIRQARETQKILEKEGKVPRDRMPVFGIPLGIKDVLTIDGVRTTAASKILDNYIPPYTSTAVRRLEDAGAISLGKLNMDEFAMGGSNENSAYGPVKHPTHPDRVPGGSSGGSAAAVRAGLCLAALGTDTGGSVREPASFSGVVGFKPTYGRISRYGLIAFASSLDQVGPMTHTVEDAARLYDVMAGHDPKDSTSVPMETGKTADMIGKALDWSRIRVGLPREYMSDGVAPDVQKAVQASIDWFRRRGAQIKEISLPHTEYAVATYYIVAVSEASSNLARFDGVRYAVRPKEASAAKNLPDFYKKVRSHFGPEVKRRIILGTFALSSGYYDAYFNRACSVRRLIRRDFETAFEEVDVIAAPVAPNTAFKMGEKSRNPLEMYLMDIFTIPASLAGLPGISVPCGEDGEGLPIGLQLIGPHFKEDSLLAIAHAFEEGRRNG